MTLEPHEWLTDAAKEQLEEWDASEEHQYPFAGSPEEAEMVCWMSALAASIAQVAWVWTEAISGIKDALDDWERSIPSLSSSLGMCEDLIHQEKRRRFDLLMKLRKSRRSRFN